MQYKGTSAIFTETWGDSLSLKSKVINDLQLGYLNWFLQVQGIWLQTVLNWKCEGLCWKLCISVMLPYLCGGAGELHQIYDSRPAEELSRDQFSLPQVTVSNRPGIAGAVLQTHLSSTDWLNSLVIVFLQIFKTPSLPNQKSYGPDIFWEFSPPSRCHMSQVTRLMLSVSCHV